MYIGIVDVYRCSRCI